MWMAERPPSGSREPRSVLPSMAISLWSVAWWTASIQLKRHFSNAAGSIRAKTRANVSSHGTPGDRSRYRANQLRRSKTNSWIPAIESDPERTPHTAMKTMLISGCLRARGIRGSGRSWKCRSNEADPLLAIVRYSLKSKSMSPFDQRYIRKKSFAGPPVGTLLMIRTGKARDARTRKSKALRRFSTLRERQARHRIYHNSCVESKMRWP